MMIAIEDDEQQVDADGADMGSEIKDTEVKVSGTDEMQAIDSDATSEDDTAGLSKLMIARSPHLCGSRACETRTLSQIYMDLNYIDPQARVLDYCFN